MAKKPKSLFEDLPASDDPVAVELIRKALWIVAAQGSPALDPADVEEWKRDAIKYINA